MLRFFSDKIKIVFFDLEYYVPLSDRERKTPSGMAFSSVRTGHKILGGTFQTYYPIQDRLEHRKSIWEWHYGSEQEVLRSIFDHFQREWVSIRNKNQAGSLMLSGIGISHSDVPALLARLSLSNIARQDKIYDLLCGCRQIYNRYILPVFVQQFLFRIPQEKS